MANSMTVLGGHLIEVGVVVVVQCGYLHLHTVLADHFDVLGVPELLVSLLSDRLYSVYSVYVVCSVCSVYRVSVYSVCSVCSVYSVCSVCSVYSVYVVCICACVQCECV